jgi:5-methyltetrahydrofolate--homocysteine methyltransferase
MTDALARMLAAREVILADGAPGPRLSALGLSATMAPELWNMAEPAKIATLHRESVAAGSDLLLTNTLGGTVPRLMPQAAQKRVREINRIGAEIARNAADRTDRKIVVAGTVGPTGEIMAPGGSLSHALAVEMFHEQADALKEGGADLLWLDTFSTPEEVLAAVEAVALAGLPWCGSTTGIGPADLLPLIADLTPQPLAIGATCGASASDTVRSVLAVGAQGTRLPIIAMGNPGIPKDQDSQTQNDGDCARMADYAVMARDAGARIIGGGDSTAEHLRHMRDALDSRPRNEPPWLEQIAKTLGPFSTLPEGAGDAPAPRGDGRRRRHG